MGSLSSVTPALALLQKNDIGYNNPNTYNNYDSSKKEIQFWGQPAYGKWISYGIHKDKNLCACNTDASANEPVQEDIRDMGVLRGTPPAATCLMKHIPLLSNSRKAPDDAEDSYPLKLPQAASRKHVV